MQRTWMVLINVGCVTAASCLGGCAKQASNETPTLFYAREGADSTRADAVAFYASRQDPLVTQPLYFDRENPNRRRVLAAPPVVDATPVSLSIDSPLVVHADDDDQVTTPVAISLRDDDVPTIEDTPVILAVANHESVTQDFADVVPEEAATPAPMDSGLLPSDQIAVVAAPTHSAEIVAAPEHPVLAEVTPAGTLADQSAPVSADRRTVLSDLERAAAADPSSLERKLALAGHLFYDGQAGDDDAALRARNLLTTLHRARPRDVLVAAYLSVSNLKQASQSTSIWRRSEMTRRSLRMLDDAVERAELNLEVRYLRGVATIDLPVMFGRHDTAVADIANVAVRARSAVETGTLDRTVAATACYYHARLLLEANKHAEARAALRDTIDIAPDSVVAAAAASYMQAVRVAAVR